MIIGRREVRSAVVGKSGSSRNRICVSVLFHLELIGRPIPLIRGEAREVLENRARRRRVAANNTAVLVVIDMMAAPMTARRHRL